MFVPIHTAAYARRQSIAADAGMAALRADERLGDHAVVVVFDLWHLGTRWTDRFLPSELAPA